MELSPKSYIISYAIIVTVLVLSFLLGRNRTQGPVRLRLWNRDGRKEGSHQLAANEESAPVFRDADYVPRRKNPYGQEALKELLGDEVEKNLNVIFNYNGHSWDAYEVFGLPAGSSNERVHQAFVEMCKKVDSESVAFLQAARDAILKKDD